MELCPRIGETGDTSAYVARNQSELAYQYVKYISKFYNIPVTLVAYFLHISMSEYIEVLKRYHVFAAFMHGSLGILTYN
jgi:hypothetical protein